MSTMLLRPSSLHRAPARLVRLGLIAWLATGAGCGGDGPARTLPDAPTTTEPDAATPPTDTSCTPTSPATETCDGIDNDCNGFIDDVDLGSDGIYDCQRVLLLGSQGTRPASNFEKWAHGNGTTVTRMADAKVTINAALLASYDLVLLDHLPRAYSTDEATALATWVQAGGGVMALSGYTGGATDLSFPNSLVSGMGVRFDGALLSGPVTKFAAHPLTSGLSSVTFSGGFAVAIDATASQPITIGQIGTTTVAVAITRGTGRVYLWGDEWVTFDSEWAGSTEIQQFWVDAFGWLGKFR